jgi:3-hydroxymyristoyl/3-hydroxydecanoyl-(acyl carrier protein) dehydratase
VTVNSSVIEPKEVFQFRKVDASTLAWKVPDSLPYLAGHFPGNPIVPGIAMIDACLEAYRILTGLSETPFIKKIQSAKFTGLIRPLDQVEIVFETRNELKCLYIKKDGVQTAEIIFAI